MTEKRKGRAMAKGRMDEEEEEEEEEGARKGFELLPERNGRFEVPPRAQRNNKKCQPPGGVSRLPGEMSYDSLDSLDRLR